MQTAMLPRGDRSGIDASLLRRAKAGDAAALKVIYDTYVQYLCAVCSVYLPNDEDVKDVLQDSFLKIFSSISSFEWKGEPYFKAWLRQIVVNQALMLLRSRQRTDFVSLDESISQDLVEDSSNESVLEGAEASEILSLLPRLPEGYRTVFNLYVFEQMSHKQIASTLGISEGTSYSQFSRAKALLSKMIKEKYKG